MSEGWIKLHRSLLDENSSFQELTAIQQIIAIYILLKTNHKETVWHDRHHGEKIKVSRGQLVASRATIQSWFPNDANVSEQIIRTAIKKLQKINFLTKQSTNGYTLLNVVNYSVYQEQNNEPNQATNQALTRPQPGPNQALTTNKNDKNDLRMKITSSSPYPSSGEGGRFTGKKVFFKIKRNGVQTTESDWILSSLCLAEKRFYTGLSLDEFLQLYPNTQKTFNRWMAHELAVRMSAYAVTMTKSNAKNELTYALALADKSSYDLNVLSDYLDFFRGNIEKNDLEVEFDG